jgi:tRNA/tmRNA/rRNA uracil-C5-methylase (TrmA/RlmC/RlmD family)
MPPVKVGDEITISGGELVAGGASLARVDGFPIFATNVFPEDVAVVRLFEVKKGFARADLVRLVEPSRWRRQQPCPVAEECGGCDWTALRLDRQLEAKERILVESLRRIGRFDPASLPPIAIHPSPLNYRIRSRLHREGDAVGFYAMRSNRVVQLPEECEVVGVQTAKARGIEGTTWEAGSELLTGHHELTISVDRYSWRLSTDAFFQVNRHLLGTLLRLVRAHAARVVNRRAAVDLYAGVGFFTLPIAELYERVTAMEGSPVSAAWARQNVPSNVRVIEGAVDNIPRADFIFLDPPRAGAAKEVISQVAEKAKEMVCYLSCDPVTFARDANRLNASGWRLSSLDLLDLFPNTHHVETLSSFERAR